MELRLCVADPSIYMLYIIICVDTIPPIVFGYGSIVPRGIRL